MGKNTKQILKAKKRGDKQAVQKLQQDMGVVDYTCETQNFLEKEKGIFKEKVLKDNSYTVLTDMESEDLYNNMPQKTEVIDDIGQRYDPTTTIEDVVAYIREHYPETEEMFKKELNNMYLTFCSKQFDYGPNNIAMGTLLSNDKEISMSLLGIIVRLNDKVNRMVNLATKHDFKAQNEPIEDAFLDVAIYCVMALIVKSGKWSK
jgi:hypothetical protein